MTPEQRAAARKRLAGRIGMPATVEMSLSDRALTAMHDAVTEAFIFGTAIIPQPKADDIVFRRRPSFSEFSRKAAA